MSKSKSDDERPTAQLACWIRRETKDNAIEQARKRGLKLNYYIDRAVRRQVRKDAATSDEDDDDADS